MSVRVDGRVVDMNGRVMSGWMGRWPRLMGGCAWPIAKGIPINHCRKYVAVIRWDF